MLDVDDRRPVEDVLWTPEGWAEVHRRAGVSMTAVHRPLGLASEPYDWRSETTVPPWTIYVLERPR